MFYCIDVVMCVYNKS